MGALSARSSALPAFGVVARRTHDASHALVLNHASPKACSMTEHTSAHRGGCGCAPTDPRAHRFRPLWIALLPVLTVVLLTAGPALAHGVAEGDKGYIQEITGVHLIPFVYLGAKHMVTGYDHLLFLFGVIFFLYRSKDIGLYVSLFALGHSTTMLLGVYFGWNVSSYLVDAIIGLSVVYKALDNLGAFQRWLSVQPNTKVATLVFGFFHGLGLATKILEYQIAQD